MAKHLTPAAVRAAVDRLIERGELPPLATGPELAGGPIVLELDDHVSDENVSASRLRVVLRSAREVRALARELDADDGRTRTGGRRR